MKRLGVMGFAVLCLLVLSAPAMSQGRSSKQPKDDVLGSGYLVPKPDLQRDVLQQFLRLFEGGASVRVENWYPDGPDTLQYRYFGDGFFGHYWEERIADRKPSDILPFWVTHFMESCKGRFAAASEPPVARGPDMVQSSAWTCAAREGAVRGVHHAPALRRDCRRLCHHAADKRQIFSPEHRSANSSASP